MDILNGKDPSYRACIGPLTLHFVGLAQYWEEEEEEEERDQDLWLVKGGEFDQHKRSAG